MLTKMGHILCGNQFHLIATSLFSGVMYLWLYEQPKSEQQSAITLCFNG